MILDGIFCNLYPRRKNGIQNLLDEVVLKQEYEKFERGNKSAGTRARKSLQNIKNRAGSGVETGSKEIRIIFNMITEEEVIRT